MLRAAELRGGPPRASTADRCAAEYPRRADDQPASVLDEVKATAASYSDSTRRSSDPFFTLVRDLADDAADAGGKLFDRFGRGRRRKRERWSASGTDTADGNR